MAYLSLRRCRSLTLSLHFKTVSIFYVFFIIAADRGKSMKLSPRTAERLYNSNTNFTKSRIKLTKQTHTLALALTR